MTTMIVPYTYFYPDRWVVKIKGYDPQEEQWLKETYYVNEDVYDTLGIGNEFVYSRHGGTTQEPYTRERKNG